MDGTRSARICLPAYQVVDGLPRGLLYIHYPKQMLLLLLLLLLLWVQADKDVIRTVRNVRRNVATSRHLQCRSIDSSLRGTRLVVKGMRKYTTLMSHAFP